MCICLSCYRTYFAEFDPIFSRLFVAASDSHTRPFATTAATQPANSLEALAASAGSVCVQLRRCVSRQREGAPQLELFEK